MNIEEMTNEDLVTAFAGSFMAPLELARKAYRTELLRRLNAGANVKFDDLSPEFSRTEGKTSELRRTTSGMGKW